MITLDIGSHQSSHSNSIYNPHFIDKLGSKPSRTQRLPERILKRIGNHPYRAKQPNGWSDHSDDWMSPELLIRRLVFADRSYDFIKPENNNPDFYKKIINKNFDKPDEIYNYLFKNMVYRKSEKNVLLFNHPEFLKA